MKIAVVVNEFPKLSETFILNQITGLLELGHDVEIFAKFDSKEAKVHSDVKKYHLMERVCYFDRSHLPQDKIKRILKAIYLIIINFHKSPIKILKLLKLRLLNRCRREKFSLLLSQVTPFLDKDFDIIHCHFGPVGNAWMFLKNVFPEIKFIVSFHGYDVNSYPKIAGKDVYKNLFEKSDLFTANTNFTKQQLIKLGYDEKKIEILPVGLRIDRFKHSSRKPQPGEPVRILTVGRLVKKKGHEYAIKAIAKLIANHKNIIYIIAGDGPMRSKLESLVLKLGIKNYVKFLGVVKQNEVLKLYQQADIFVLSSVTSSDSDREGQALVLQEAQATGLPVVSTLHDGIPEGVLDGQSGFLVPEKDVDALTERIKYLIVHPQIWSKMGKCGREFVESKYNIKKLNQQLVKIYQGI